MTPEIRAASAADAAGIASVHLASRRRAFPTMVSPTDGGPSLASLTSAWRAMLALPLGNHVLVAVEQDSVVGFASLGGPQHTDDAAEGVCELHTLYVAPDLLGRGIGRRLLRGAEDEMVRRGSRRALLWVLGANTPARRLYESRGWRPDGTARKGMVRYGKTLPEISQVPGREQRSPFDTAPAPGT